MPRLGPITTVTYPVITPLSNVVDRKKQHSNIAYYMKTALKTAYYALKQFFRNSGIFGFNSFNTRDANKFSKKHNLTGSPNANAAIQSLYYARNYFDVQLSNVVWGEYSSYLGNKLEKRVSEKVKICNIHVNIEPHKDDLSLKDNVIRIVNEAQKKR